MVRIGIISPMHKENIRKCIKTILPHSASVSHSADQDILTALENAGIQCCIIDLEKNSCFVDILIFDTSNRSLAAKALRSISPDTRLLYNSDCCPPIIHPYAISYGFSRSATVTVSSVDDAGLLLYLHPIIRLDNTVCIEQEYRIPCSDECISEMLCAFACGALCSGISSASGTDLM